MKAIRNLTAFHLDEYDETTRETFSKMELAWYPLMAADQADALNLYFEFADIVDLGHLVFKFADGREWKETAEDINKTVLDFAGKFAIAATLFLQHLMRKTKIGDFTKTAYEAQKPPKPRMPSLSELAAASLQKKTSDSGVELSAGKDLLHTGGEGGSET